MKNISHFDVILRTLIIVYFVTSCRSTEDTRLDRFLGTWKLESICTMTSELTLTNATVTIAKAKPHGVWFTAPACGSAHLIPSDLFLHFDTKTNSYLLYVRNSDPDSFLRGFGIGRDISLTYSDASGFTMGSEDEGISIKWDSNGHTWKFSRKMPNGLFSVQTMEFRK